VLADLYYLSVVVVVALSASLPWRLKQLLVDSIARIAYSCSVTKRRRMESRVRVAMPELDARARGSIVRGAFRATWHEMFSYVPTRAECAAVSAAALSGAEHLRAAVAARRGAILWVSAGFGRRIDAMRVLHAHGFLTVQVHGPNSLGSFLTDNATATWARRELAGRFFQRCERTACAEMITLSRSGSLAVARQLQRRTEANAILCITADGKEGSRFVRGELCGIRERFATGMVTLARGCGAPILPLFCFGAYGGAIRVVIEPPLKISPGGRRDEEIESAIREYARLLESYMRRYPAQYRNWHLLGADLPAA
jgi:lauroyl/myristoyl acyltransferase